MFLDLFCMASVFDMGGECGAGGGGVGGAAGVETSVLWRTGSLTGA